MGISAIGGCIFDSIISDVHGRTDGGQKTVQFCCTVEFIILTLRLTTDDNTAAISCKFGNGFQKCIGMKHFGFMTSINRIAPSS